MKKYNLPVEDPMAMEKILAATALDKKRSGGMISVIMLKEIGDGFVDQIYRDRFAELTGVL